MYGSRRFVAPALKAAGMVAAALAIVSCTSIGPRTIPRDQFDYSDALASSGREQLLTNMIRLRYVEAPVFVDVASVITQYSLESQVSAGLGANASISGDDIATLGGAARFTDKPTITYTPVGGRQFSISLLTPVSPEAIFALIQAGWAPEVIMRITVRSINGVENALAAPLNRHQADPRFVELMHAWGRLREARALGLRKDEGGQGAKIVVYQTREKIDSEAQSALRFLQETLELDPDAREYTLRYGLVPETSQEIAVLTTSMLELMNELAWRADVPPEHVEDGRTGTTFMDDDEQSPLIRIHYAEEKPESSFVAIRNRDYWFYIDDRDVRSKRTFAILQILLSLTESGEPGRGPVVTIGS